MTQGVEHSPNDVTKRPVGLCGPGKICFLFFVFHFVVVCFFFLIKMSIMTDSLSRGLRLLCVQYLAR